MSRTAALLLLVVVALPTGGRAQTDDAPESAAGQQLEQVDEDELIRIMHERLKSDPAVADSLAARINQSKIADRLSGAEDPNQRLGEIRAWISQDPQSAAGLAVGLSKDDANGTHSFEEMVMRTTHSYLRPNPGSKNGIFGRLKKSSKDSKLIKGQSEDISDEEKREILKTMFEGQGSQSSKIITQQADDSKGGALGSSYYSRLSQGNLHGYSPQLQAMQSALNSRRAPGAPKLIETGTLDYETLSYPAYGMKFDVANLDKRLRAERAAALARLLGAEGRYTAEQLRDPAVEATLIAQAGGKPLPARFLRRQAALERATSALRGFTAAALAAKDPNQISRPLLITLGDKQKEAAHWITVASLEEELQHLDEQEVFLSPELLSAIKACPADEGSRQAYLRRGEGFQAAVKTLKANDESAVSQLSADDWLSKVTGIEKLLTANAALRKNLQRNIDDYRATATRFAGSVDARAGWRRTIDRCVERFLPWTNYARALRRARARRDLLKDVFLKIAAGDLDAAHAVLASSQ